jgi:hypothetical protein
MMEQPPPKRQFGRSNRLWNAIFAFNLCSNQTIGCFQLIELSIVTPIEGRFYTPAQSIHRHTSGPIIWRCWTVILIHLE